MQYRRLLVNFWQKFSINCSRFICTNEKQNGGKLFTQQKQPKIMHFRAYVFLFTVAILFAAAFADPVSELEVECSALSASTATHEPFVPMEKLSLRTDNFTQAEYEAYSALRNSSTTFCNIAPLVQSYSHQRLGRRTVYLTYIEARCLNGVRAAASQLTLNIRNISSDRAVTLLLDERADTDDPVHYDVIDPVRHLLIELHVLRCATPIITGKIYAAGTLPNLVTLELQGCSTSQ
ncbi:uncharacterized protein LOC129602114 [Paramacrobiotus metropolitanus]|uniref:uncharacterized protein LOC129602114 n=1 Tax=Paramacrobiotus metropolitanus TaxID=2943436 RepID=UPI00244613DC|nr:uncharacterized protein LOC129602114 [Paramacrobiotus metropolitanus]